MWTLRSPCFGTPPVAGTRKTQRERQARGVQLYAAQTAQQYAWTGADEFTPLGDRVDAPPLPLPAIESKRRVVLVRHGQSTWNAEGRIQGSSDFSCLTPKGVSQAETTRGMVRDSAAPPMCVAAARPPHHAALGPLFGGSTQRLG